MAEHAANPVCPVCTGETHRSLRAEQKGTIAKRPYLSDAMAIPPSVMREVEEVGPGRYVRNFREAVAPGRHIVRKIPIETFGNRLAPDGRLVVNNQDEKRRQLKERGLTEYGPPTDREMREE